MTDLITMLMGEIASTLLGLKKDKHTEVFTHADFDGIGPDEILVVKAEIRKIPPLEMDDFNAT